MPQGFQEREDVGVRLGIEKAIKADEALSRSQVIAGLNIYFTYAGANDEDIYINASTSVTAVGARQLHVIVIPSLRPSGGTGQNWISAGGPISIEEFGYNTSGGATPDTFKYGTVFYADIVHNWGLSSANRFICDIKDTRLTGGVTAAHQEINSRPKVIGINNNTVRIWVTRSRSAVLDGARVPRYEFSLMEVI